MKIIGEYHDQTFYFQDVVKRQVEREAWQSWAAKPTPAHVVVPPLTQAQTWSVTAKHAFYSAIRGAIA